MNRPRLLCDVRDTPICAPRSMRAKGMRESATCTSLVPSNTGPTSKPQPPSGGITRWIRRWIYSSAVKQRLEAMLPSSEHKNNDQGIVVSLAQLALFRTIPLSFSMPCLPNMHRGFEFKNGLNGEFPSHTNVVETEAKAGRALIT